MTMWLLKLLPSFINLKSILGLLKGNLLYIVAAIAIILFYWYHTYNINKLNDIIIARDINITETQKILNEKDQAIAMNIALQKLAQSETENCLAQIELQNQKIRDNALDYEKLKEHTSEIEKKLKNIKPPKKNDDATKKLKYYEQIMQESSNVRFK